MRTYACFSCIPLTRDPIELSPGWWESATTGSCEITEKTSLTHKAIYFLWEINYFIDCSSVFEQNDMTRKGVIVEKGKNSSVCYLSAQN